MALPLRLDGVLRSAAAGRHCCEAFGRALAPLARGRPHWIRLADSRGQQALRDDRWYRFFTMKPDLPGEL